MLQVIFTDISVAGDTTIANWSWNFGDGNTSTEQDPVHEYATAGTYSVSLTVIDANGLSNISTQNVTVTSELVGPTANFTHSDSYLIIQFTDASQTGDGIINNWNWNFGDGNTSTDQSPSHTYDTYGVYDVSLTATDNLGMAGTETKTNYITVNYAGPVWYVSNDGDDTGQGTAGDPLATIGFAVYNASGGDSILINHELKNNDLDEMIVDVNKSKIGHLASGIPGTVDGMINLHEKFGILDWKSLLVPSI